MLAGDVVEYIYSADPDKYFDAMARGASRGGAQAAAFVEFSSSSIIAAKVTPRPPTHPCTSVCMHAP